jgi:hypothetical protein
LNNNHTDNLTYKVILVLGSYDPETKVILDNLKESLSQNFMYIKDNIFIFILDNIEIYIADIIDNYNVKRKFTLIIEKYDNNRLSIICTDFITIFDISDLKFIDNIERSIQKYLNTNYLESSFSKLSILDELKVLSKSSSLTFVIRNQELTKGGEYIELVYLLANGFLQPENIYLLKKEGFTLSSMAWELLDYYKIHYRSYTKEIDLHRETKRIFQNYIRVYNEK